MPPSATNDRRYLELKNGKWRVTIAVPRDLQHKLGTKLKRPLNTDSLAVANGLKWQVVSELRATIAAAKGSHGETDDPLIREALEIAAAREKARTPEELDGLDYVTHERAEAIRGAPVAIPDPDSPDPDGDDVFDPRRSRQAIEFAQIAQGKALPIGHHHEQYLSQTKTKPRTQADDRRAIAFLGQWCERHHVAPYVQSFTRKTAYRFRDDLQDLAGGQSPITLQKYVYRLSRYWKWLEERGIVDANPWAGIRFEHEEPKHDEKERSFTRDEMIALLAGPAKPALHDLMRIAALTGARLDAIVDLKVGDCEDGRFIFKPQKKEKAPRAVPIHSDLVEIVTRRREGKGKADSLFPEWPPPKKAGSKRERSFKASNAFTAYRRSVGVDEIIEGKRRSLVNFHSFRRWFITEAERADQPESIIAVVVGHKRKGMTLGRYSAGPLFEQAQRCVEAVKLPDLDCHGG